MCVLLEFSDRLCAGIDYCMCVFCWNLMTDYVLQVCWLQRISIHCRCCVVCSELAFAAEIEFSVDSLPKLNCLQRINICCRKCVGCSELAFAAEVVLFAANQHSLPEVCVLQRISVRCQKYVGCSKWAFTAEVFLSAANQCSLPKWVAWSELAFAIESALAAAK